jgi:hypothetical protein
MKEQERRRWEKERRSRERTKKYSADLHSLLISAMYYSRYQEEYEERMKEQERRRWEKERRSRERTKKYSVDLHSLLCTTGDTRRSMKRG